MQSAFDEAIQLSARPCLLTLCLLSLTACTGKTPPSAGPVGASSTPPPIHYDQISVLTSEGQPTEQHSYQRLRDDCQKSGLPMHALAPEDESKLGRVHVEAWIGPHKQSRREEEWHIEDSTPCQFSLTHKDQTQIDDANGRATLIDATTHTVEVQELGKPGPVTALPASDGELTDGERQAGWTKKGIASDHGVECAIWEDAGGFRLCVWTGGREWGYSADGATALKDGLSRGDSIVMWAHPGRAPGWRLETSQFAVGPKLDERAFALPANSAP